MCCHMIWGHPPPPAQASVGELFILVHTESRKTEKLGSHFARERVWEFCVGVDKNHAAAQNFDFLYTVFTLRTVGTSVLAVMVSPLFISVTSRCCTNGNLLLCKR
jgi:hypothetical protein